MTTMRLPIEIVGGGLAGLSLGGALQRAGVPVTILEAGSYPRHRVCGEFMAGLAPATIGRLGLAPMLGDACVHRQVAWYRGDGPAPLRRQELPAPALGLSRFALDARLAAAFLTAGGQLLTGRRLAGMDRAPGRVFATGRWRGRTAWLGLKLHAAGLPLAADLEVHLGEQAYVGLARIETGEVNVCGLFRRRDVRAKGAKILSGYLRAAGLNALAARVGQAVVDPDSFCAVAALDFGGRPPGVDRILLGDAGAMIPPFTGNGMAIAFQSAEAALEPLLAYSRGRQTWEETVRAIAAALRRRFRLRLAAAGVLHPFLLEPGRQRVLGALARAKLLPLGPLYAALH
jgi:flavin-dependent dehydrogenase